VSHVRNRLALLLTLRRMGDLGEGLLYLHTLTFPPPEPSCEEALSRWHSLAVNFLRKSGKRCARVIERGAERGRVHLHLVSWERWDAAEMHRVLPKYGFGGYNVREIPASRASYVAKYLGKDTQWRLPRGTRLWACVGWKGVRVSDVRIKRTSTPVGGSFCAQRPFTLLQWVIGGKPLPPIRLRLTEGSEETKMLELKSHQVDEVMGFQCRGSIGVVAEYRGTSARVWDGTAWNQPTVKVHRVYADHNVEAGGKAVLVTELLPEGAEVSSVKPPANRGELVYVEVTGLEVRKGQVICRGSLRPLSVLPLKGGGRA